MSFESTRGSSPVVATGSLLFLRRSSPQHFFAQVTNLDAAKRAVEGDLQRAVEGDLFAGLACLKACQGHHVNEEPPNQRLRSQS